MTEVDDHLELGEQETGAAFFDGGGFTPEGPDEELVTGPAGPPGPFEPDGPIGRSEVLVRAQSWIDERVPYSQTSKHTNDFGSYRADCSGFMSMAWHLSASLTTFSLPDVMDEIELSDLRDGDALWQRANGEGHIALFLRWANPAKTMPVVQEEFDFGEVAEEHIWQSASGFFPRRYKRITDDELRMAAAVLGDGSLVQAAGTPVAVLAGGARIPLASRAERVAIGAGDTPVTSLTKEQWNDLPTIPDDGTLISGAPGLPVALVVGGARINMHDADEISESGHSGERVQPIPARAFRSMTSRIADGTLIGAAGLPVAVIIGGARINLRDNDEKVETGHANDPVHRLPRRVFTGLPGRIADSTMVTAAGLPTAIMAGGARINFRDGAEIVATHNNNRGIRKLPRRVFNGLTGRIADGTLVSAPNLPVALIAGGARVNLRDAGEITTTGHGGQPVTRIPERVFTGLETDFADGTLLRSPAAAETWRMAGGRRSRVNGGAAQLVPQRVLDGIPVA
jgi:hypothetical protein